MTDDEIQIERMKTVQHTQRMQRLLYLYLPAGSILALALGIIAGVLAS